MSVLLMRRLDVSHCQFFFDRVRRHEVVGVVSDPDQRKGHDTQCGEEDGAVSAGNTGVPRSGSGISRGFADRVYLLLSAYS